MSINRKDNNEPFNEKRVEQMHESLKGLRADTGKTLDLNTQNKIHGDIYDRVEILLYALSQGNNKLAKSMLATLYKVERSPKSKKVVFNPVALKALDYIWSKDTKQKAADEASLKKIISGT